MDLKDFTVDSVAKEFYTRYCTAVGGKAYNGDPLPTWENFKADPYKRLQSNGWLEVAKYAVELMTSLQK